jgi:predicted TIM-barrel fold metal-dependent hydrolase
MANTTAKTKGHSAAKPRADIDLAINPALDEVSRIGATAARTERHLHLVDIHTHLVGDPGRFDLTLRRSNSSMPDGFDRLRIGRDPDALIEYLNTECVAIAGIIGDNGPTAGYSIDANYVTGFVAQRPDRLFGIAPMNVHVDGNALGEAAARLLGTGVIRGFKNYTSSHRNDPLDERLKDVYDICNERRTPFLFHTGAADRYQYADLRLANVDRLEPIVRDYPDMPVVLCHGGNGGQTEMAARLAHEYENCFIDIADMSARNIQRALQIVCPLKIMFGTDMPQYPHYDALVRRVTDLPISFWGKSRILTWNAVELFGLELPCGCTESASAEVT